MTSSSTSHGPSTGLVETIAGLSAGLASTIIVHPLDIIKTRLQVDNTAHPLLNSSRAVLRDILRNEGPTRIAALYRGLTPNLVGNSAGWASYFLWYQQAQDLIRSYKGYEADKPLSSVEYMMASTASGVLSSLLTNPIWVIKTRMVTTSASQTGAYPSMIAGFKTLYKSEGPRGLFHGLTPTLFGVSHGALYFVAYEKLKLWRREKRADKQLTNGDTILTSSLSKVFAGSLTYPHQVLRARMQTYNPAADVHVQGPRMMDVIRTIWRNEGFLGYYKGLFPNLLRVVPSTCVTFLVYENVRREVPRLFNRDGDEGSVINNHRPNEQKKSSI